MKRLLLIDDDKSEHMFVNFLLKDIYQQNFNLGYAANIEDAGRFLESKGVDFILLDDKLADGTLSSESIPQLQRKAFNVPIIIISKDTDSRHLKDRARLGLNKVVDKFKLRQALSSGLLD